MNAPARRPVARLLYLVSHPIQYQAPLLRRVAGMEGIELRVRFLSDFSAREYVDTGFQTALRWDVPLLEGYRSEALSSVPQVSPLRPLRPDIGRVLERERTDVLWVHGWSQVTLLWAIAAATRRGIPVLLRGESKSEPRSALRRALQRTIARRIAGALAIGRENRRFYEELGVGPERLFDMPYGVDNDFFRERAQASARAREPFRARLGLDPRRPVILFASKLIERKRPADLWAAYRRLAGPGGTEPRPYLLFVGDGPERAALERETRASGWTSVRWLGFRNQTELPALYDLCNVFVLPSAYETWGLVLNEAMNAGRAVITTEGVGAAADLVREGHTGHVVGVGAVEQLAERLQRLTSDNELCSRMGLAARARVAAFGLDAACTGLRRAIEHVVPCSNHASFARCAGEERAA